MKNIYVVSVFFYLIFFLFSCGLNKNNLSKTKSEADLQVNISAQQKYKYEYRQTPPIINDLIHTKLNLSFDTKNKKAFGSAVITLKPHFYKTDSLELDAKFFDIKKVALYKSESNIVPLKYIYDNYKLKIKLDRFYQNTDTFNIYIEYTANPEKITEPGSSAINDNKGLYFIDSESENPQIWTQGETQSNSGWFPTIDLPNQKMTQEIFLTVDRNFKTLSNGKLVTSLLNDDGTRTDYWKQENKHAPYLTMIAVGKFEILEDYWRDMPVFIYCEPGDEQNAKDVCGKTYKMLDLYSQILKFNYPWEKYNQVFVRNFVSGAMENTGATVLGRYLLKFSNETQRIDNECTIAHELSHHWFGNIVTCESWANLPLNESFATYMEYVWLESEYGKTEADRHLFNDRQYFAWEYMYKNEELVRFHYKYRDDMFDTHSYQKGALILHMLRNETGDKAFWAALNLYLNKFAYSTAEIHDLRQAFEQITGKDYNPFFNQWFLDKGIPEINTVFTYDNSTDIQTIIVNQTQKTEIAPLYNFNTIIAFYFGQDIVYKTVNISKPQNVYTFKFEQKPDLIIFDPENTILSKYKQNYSKEEYILILKNKTSYKNKFEAYNFLKPQIKDENVKKAFINLLDSDFWEYKLWAMQTLKISKNDKLYNEYQAKIKNIAQNDKNQDVKKYAENILKQTK